MDCVDQKKMWRTLMQINYYAKKEEGDEQKDDGTNFYHPKPVLQVLLYMTRPGSDVSFA